jgi:hypothetical protein
MLLPPQLGCLSVAPLLLHAVQRARWRSTSLDAVDPHRMPTSAGTFFGDTITPGEIPLHLVDYVLLALTAAAGLVATAGGIMLTARRPPNRAVKAAFYIAAACFGLLGILWGMQARDYSMSVRLGAAAITAAVAAIALTYVLSLISDHFESESPIPTVRTAFSATESIKMWPPFLGGTEMLNLDNVAVLRALTETNDQITFALNSVPIRMRDIDTPDLKIQGAQFHIIKGDTPEYLFDRDKNKRHEITVEGRTFVVILQDIVPRDIPNVASPIEYIFGISEK